MAPPDLPGVTLHDIDGGPDYYAQWDIAFPDDPTFFPIGVWAESLNALTDTVFSMTYKQIVDAYTGMGINFYPGTYAYHSSINTYFGTQGLWAIGGSSQGDSRCAGLGITDEPDWRGCNEVPGGTATEAPPAIGACYTLGDPTPPSPAGTGPTHPTFMAAWADHERAQYPATRPVYGQFTKICRAGFQSEDSWVNSTADILAYTGSVDIVSYDWYPMITGYMDDDEHHTYIQGDSTAMLRSQMGFTKPVMGFIETSEISDERDPIYRPTPADVNHEVWSSVIAGARGVQYFNHNFSSAGHATARVLLDDMYTDIRAQVTATNAKIHSLAHAINAPFLNGLLEPQVTAIGSVPGWRTMVKWEESEGKIYIFATPRKNTTASVTKDFNLLTAIPASTVEVVGESRTLPVTNGGTRFTDTFATQQAVHVYRFDVTPAVVPDPWTTVIPKVFDGTDWVDGSAKVFDGVDWVDGVVKVHD